MPIKDLFRRIRNIRNSKDLKLFLKDYKNLFATIVVIILVCVAIAVYASTGNKPTDLPNYTDGPVNQGEQQEAPKIYVDISGEVKVPGVYEVEEGTRLFMVIEMAGGLTEKACIDEINRAEEVYDGEKILIPSLANAKTSSSGVTNGKVNINLADKAALMTLPGIGETKANAIINYREKSGRFKKITDLKNVSGIGDTTYNNLADLITV